MKADIPVRTFGLLALMASLLMLGCATEPDITQDPDFGQSVRHMIALQTADPWSGGTGLDGEKATATLRVYREQVAEPQETLDRELIGIPLGIGP
ncbi:hypothetical protein [Thiocapsa roseopersicina]|uniref:Uncharacterized protein n=1 Tax=Thiocapsa roseopersicina TaxID=1058 RepID=A0A1H3BRE3_THIRO|nr:hypothetical protein [Thiocapsa roseopersicina]SDX44513.1 hypothetical protein SAMN05421783_12645 [Thiocapsa roseopersicina]